MLRLVVFKMNFIFLYLTPFEFLFIALFSVPRLVDRCRSNEFKCLDGSCVSQTARCDGRSDCRDRSDEYNCTGIIMFPSFYFISTGPWTCTYTFIYFLIKKEIK